MNQLDRQQHPKDLQFRLPTPLDCNEFQFPFEPYSIQYEFMQKLYTVIEKGQVAIFESPTGTGKSLSLICGALKWLNDNASRHENPLGNSAESDTASNEPSWILEYHREQMREREKQKKQELANRIRRIRERELAQQRTPSSFLSRKKMKTKHENEFHQIHCNNNNNNENEEAPEEFVLDDYNSDDDDSKIGTNNNFGDNYSAEVKELLARFQENQEFELDSEKVNNKNWSGEDDEDEEPEETKIYYCSRTHSQLSQFIQEVRKTRYDELKLISLGSRKNLCINEKVQKLKNVARMNEQCMEMQKPNTKSDKKCPYFSKIGKSRMLDFRDHALALVRNIEELVEVGQKLETCPYYGTRKSIKQSQIVTLPYNLLLSKSTRESMGISLKNNVVIIDEAHNLVETITAVHTVYVDHSQISRAQLQLTRYLERYKRRLKGKNIVYIRQILALLDALTKCLNQWTKSCENKRDKENCEEIKMVNEFMHHLNIDNLNLFKLEKYLKKSNLARKLNGFMDKMEFHEVKIHPSNDDVNDYSSSIPCLNQIETFFMSLTNGDIDGRIILGFMPIAGTSKYQPYIKYLLLNPSNQFKDVVMEARSVILAGGTMEPVKDLIDQLFSYLPPEKIDRFSCGHIIPKKNLLTLVVSNGPTGMPMEFTFERRTDEKLIDQLGQTISNLCNIIPDGIVCFFGSYAYLEKVYLRWQQNNTLERIQKRKKIFREPRQSNEVDKILRDYSAHIHSIPAGSKNGGALLFCVVGGKMSEGINFADRLGRGVLMVGLPFANMNSAALKEKMKYIDQKGQDTRSGDQHSPGREYYENLCMRSVNQSIGRAIRHKTDYATIVLIDRRFSTPRIRQKLPGWICENVVECSKFGNVICNVASFFRNRD
ncbi:2198_t:CDS:10 [Ambispora leptoticha]|uniref:ATP-dependent DNA helicase CHL1 n=1 Tax=Ambispora leptoticha TaxID=144679 RepID=A0A9N9ADL1_9GLOM|nr:2198_t:CDS:10 [Ambispora leptoticha]